MIYALNVKLGKLAQDQAHPAAQEDIFALYKQMTKTFMVPYQVNINLLQGKQQVLHLLIALVDTIACHHQHYIPLAQLELTK